MKQETLVVMLEARHFSDGRFTKEGRWNKIIEKLNEPEVQPSEPETTEPEVQPSEPEEIEEIQPSEPEENPKQEEKDEDEVVDEINP